MTNENKPAARLGDSDTGHGAFPATQVISGSPNVTIDGLPAARVGDILQPHSAPKHAEHARSISSGTKYVSINGRPAAIMGSCVSCGGTLLGGSQSVSIGNKQPPAILTPKTLSQLFG